MTRLRYLWDLINRNPEDGSPLFGIRGAGPLFVAAALWALLWGFFG